MRDGLPRVKRHTARYQTDVPAQVRLITVDGDVKACGTAVISNLSEDGLQLSRVVFREGGLPSCSFFALVVPTTREHAGIWLKACIVRAVFRADCSELGGYLVGAAGLDRLLISAQFSVSSSP